VTLRDADGRIVEQIKYGAAFPGRRRRSERDRRLNESIPHRMERCLETGGHPAFPCGMHKKPTLLLPPGDSHWRWRKGAGEASQPRDAWRRPDFKEDATWQDGTTSIGYGDDDDATILTDMQGHYSCIFLRHVLKIDKPPPTLLLRVRVDDGCIVWLNGQEVARLHAPAGDLPFNAFAQDHEATEWEEVLIPNADKLLLPGANLLAVQAIQCQSQQQRSDDRHCAPNFPRAPRAGKRPTPGAQNSVFATNTPPAISRVGHQPAQPKPGEPLKITAQRDRPGRGPLSHAATCRTSIPAHTCGKRPGV